MKLNKANLVKQLCIRHPNLEKSRASASVETFLSLCKSALIRGNSLKFRGFGIFNIADKNPRRGRNPHTGIPMILDARRVVTFKPSPILRIRVEKE